MPKGDLGSATGWMKRFVGMLNLAAAFHPNRSHFAPVWEDKGARNEREWDFSAWMGYKGLGTNEFRSFKAFP